MAELSTIKNISFTDYESYRLWIELNRPSNFMDFMIDNGRMFTTIENNIEVFTTKWGI